MAVWILMTAFLWVTGNRSLHACDDGTAVPDPNNNAGLVSDCRVLLKLRDKLAGEASLNWDAGLAMGSWKGLAISESPQRVTGLNLGHNDLTGMLPPELGQLSRLQYLFLSSNQLTGPIPIELAQLTQLRETNLGRNQLTGPIPAELGQLAEMRFLYLNNNQFTGAIPVELAQLFQLRRLFLDNNQLSGMIPRELGRLFRLQQLHLQNNQLTGQIPFELEQLADLTEFRYRGNRLGGFIPPKLRDLPDVYVRNLDAVRLATGQIRVTWDDPGDPAAGYEYQLQYDNRVSTQVTPIEDPEAVLRLRGGSTIEWILGGLDPDVNYTAIVLRAWNRSGSGEGAYALVRPLEASETMNLPFCLSLWEGEPCTTAAVLPHIFMGPLGENAAQAEILITNRDPKPGSCDVAVLFHRGVSEGPEILFDGQALEDNLLHPASSAPAAISASHP